MEVRTAGECESCGWGAKEAAIGDTDGKRSTYGGQPVGEIRRRLVVVRQNREIPCRLFISGLSVFYPSCSFSGYYLGVSDASQYTVKVTIIQHSHWKKEEKKDW
jgi:hypothetical protein